MAEKNRDFFSDQPHFFPLPTGFPGAVFLTRKPAYLSFYQINKLPLLGNSILARKRRKHLSSITSALDQNSQINVKQN